MPVLKKPSSLEDLSFHAIAGHYGKAMLHYLLPSCSGKVRGLDAEEAVEEIDLDVAGLTEYLHDGLPWLLALRMTEHLLMGLKCCIAQISCTDDGFKCSGDARCKAALEGFIVASINPHVRHLDLTSMSHLIRKVLCENLSKMLKLEILIVRTYETWKEDSKDVFLQGLGQLENLVSLNMERDCIDEVIETVSKSCKSLKKLVVNGAPYVTDSCIDFILKMQALEQLELCTTGITEKGYLRLLRKMAADDGEDGHRISSLKMLGCSYVRNDQLEIIQKNYTNLTHINISSIHCNMSLLKDLRNLEELKITGGDFVINNIKELVQERGSSLKLLDFMMVGHIDLPWIGEHCTELKTLNIRTCSFVIEAVVPSYAVKKVSHFRNLEHLLFYVQCNKNLIYNVLVQCVKIRKLTIGLIIQVDDAFFMNVLEKNPMTSLEELKVYFCTLSLNTARILIARCQHLTSLGGLKSWEGLTDLEVTHFQAELHRRNLNITIQ